MPAAEVTIAGLAYIRSYLSHREQTGLLDWIDRSPWSADLRRRVQHYGFRYDYRRKTIEKSVMLGPMPGWAQELADRLHCDGLVARRLNQLIVNEYLPGQGIAHHVDCEACFADQIVSLSLGSSCVLTLRLAKTHEQVPLLLEPGSLLVLAKEARFKWTHGIAARKTDVVGGRVVARRRRVSLTYRTVLNMHRVGA